MLVSCRYRQWPSIVFFDDDDSHAIKYYTFCDTSQISCKGMCANLYLVKMNLR